MKIFWCCRRKFKQKNAKEKLLTDLLLPEAFKRDHFSSSQNVVMISVLPVSNKIPPELFGGFCGSIFANIFPNAGRVVFLSRENGVGEEGGSECSFCHNHQNSEAFRKVIQPKDLEMFGLARFT